MSLANLSDEILLRIFDYFDYIELINYFYDIIYENDRVKKLIGKKLQSIRTSKIDLQLMRKSQFSFTIDSILQGVHIKQSIRSLTLSNRWTFGQIRLFINQIKLEDFVNLEELTLIEPSYEEYRILFPTGTTALKHLRIESPDCDESNRVILIDEMADLCQLTILSKYPVQFRSQYPALEKLTVHRLSLVDFIGFSTFFPNLKELDIFIIGDEFDLSRIELPSLTVFKLRGSNVSHELCMKLISHFPLLEEILYSNEIDCSSNPIKIDGHKLENDFQKFPMLIELEIDLHVYNYSSTNICDLAGSFHTSFYLVKSWNIICETEPNSNDYHIYSLPMVNVKILKTSSDSFVSSPVFQVSNPYDRVESLALNMTPRWPVETRFFKNVSSLELLQKTSSNLISPSAVLNYLNKTVNLLNLQTLIIPSPCHFNDTVFHALFHRAKTNIRHLQISTWHLLRLIRNGVIISPLSIERLILYDDILPSSEVEPFIKFFRDTLKCLSFYAHDDDSIDTIIVMFLDNFQVLLSLDVLFKKNLSMSTHVQLCETIKSRTDVGAEIHSNKIRIWQK